MLAICLASFLGCLDLTIVNTALPSMQQTLHINLDALQWVMTALFAALSGCMVVAGKLADKLGRRYLTMIGLVIFGLASLFAAVAPSLPYLIFARILQGIGIAILYTAPPAFIYHLYEKDEIPRIMGYYFSASSLGIASGPFLGGLVVSLLGWRWIFYLNLPFVLIALLAVALCSTADEVKTKQELDVKGAILLTVGLFILLIALTYMTLNLSIGISLLAISGLTFFIFYRHEKNQRFPSSLESRIISGI